MCISNHTTARRLLTLLLIALLCLLATSSAHAASSPARTETLAAGPYIIDVQMDQDPPFTDKSFEIAVVPHNQSLHLEGRVTAKPGLGTDAVPLHYNLTSGSNQTGTLTSQVRIPVQGAWDIVIELQGPQGAGQGIISTTVAAPGAIPIWLAWLIGSSPLIFIAIWIWLQHRYRNLLLAQQKARMI